MEHSTDKQRVAIAGTVSNAATGEGIPQAVVRITEAPPAFVTTLLEGLQGDIAHHPELVDSYHHLFTGRPITADTLKTIQIILNAFERNYWLASPRLDQWITGGDGHYCFFDLPPGVYGITATFMAAHYCYGSTHGQVEVQQTDLRLAFSALDLSMSLVPIQFSIPTQIEHLHRSIHAAETWVRTSSLVCR